MAYKGIINRLNSPANMMKNFSNHPNRWKLVKEVSSQARLLEDVISINDENSEKAINAIMLKDALKTLSEYENQLLYLKYWESLTVREIAEKIHKPRSTVQYEIKGIINKLKRILDKQIIGEI